MQTFLPSPSFSRSAYCLDNKRLGKQRVECKQILLALGQKVGAHEPGKSRWINHPAVRMWRGYELCLADYSLAVCGAWKARGFVDNLTPEFTGVLHELCEIQQVNPHEIPTPPWLGDDALHASHRSNLLRKDAVHYGKFGWREPDSLPYIWPV